MKKGFTLLELLIVIGILAILATVVTLVLNPAELLKQARDSQRVSDLASLQNALGLYLADVTTPNLGVQTNCYVNATNVAANCNGRHPAKTTTYNVSRTTNGGGWIPVNFGSISSGSPLPVLPVDPKNDSTYFYSYSNTTSTWEMDAVFESNKYANSMDLDAKDGGNNDAVYEAGSEPGLSI